MESQFLQNIESKISSLFLAFIDYVIWIVRLTFTILLVFHTAVGCKQRVSSNIVSGICTTEIFNMITGKLN